MNPLILGDNLEVLKRWNSESVDWIYLAIILFLIGITTFHVI